MKIRFVRRIALCLNIPSSQYSSKIDNSSNHRSVSNQIHSNKTRMSSFVTSRNICLVGAGRPSSAWREADHITTVNGDRYRAKINNIFVLELKKVDVEDFWLVGKFTEGNFICGYVKSHVYAAKPEAIDTIENKIIFRALLLTNRPNCRKSGRKLAGTYLYNKAEFLAITLIYMYFTFALKPHV